MAAAGKKLTQTVVNNTIAASASNMQTITQSITTRFVLGGTALAAGAAYHIENVRKESESARRQTETALHKLELQYKESECLRREMEIRVESQRREMEIRVESQNREIESQRREIESQRREMESQRREYDAKLEGKSKWSWFW
jgi:hypothetical protein